MCYVLNQSSIVINGEEIVTYGITIGETAIKDVSVDRNEVLALIERFNAEDLPPESLRYAVEDFVARETPA